MADYILNDIHKKNILPLNDLKNKINKYFLGEFPDNKNDIKKNIQQQISEAIPALTKKLELLEINLTAFINRLSDY